MAPISKFRISSPIEAGPSMLDSQKLSPQITDALDYVSDRLIRKNLHLTLMVVPNASQRGPVSPLPPATPLSPLAASLYSNPRTPALCSSPRSVSTFSATPSTPSFPRPLTRLPKLNTSAVTTAPSSPSLTLLHASTLSPKATQHLNTTIAKASKKYSLDPSWLSAPTAATPLSPTCPMSPLSPAPSDLIHRSLLQNSILFSNEGLTLLHLDRVYTFKVALSAYFKALSTTRGTITRDALTKAVEELRLLVLSLNGRRISKSYLMRSYDHLPVSVEALRRVNDFHKECYGGQLPISGLGEVVEAETEDLCDRGPHLRAPTTPTAGEDVSPVTQGEWGLLMGERGASRGGVEKC